MAHRKAVRSRGVVSHYLEHVSVAALSTYRREITDMIQHHRGIYALYQNDQLYSVGLASVLQQQIRQHLQEHEAGQWNHFSLYLVRKESHIQDVEALLMRIADPSGYHRQVRLRHAADMRGQLKRTMMRHEEAKVKGMFGTWEAAAPQPGSASGGGSRSRKRSNRLKGLIKGQKRIYANYKGNVYYAVLSEQGRIKFKGKLYDSPSGAGRAITQRKTDGWAFWKILHQGQLVRLKDL